MVERHYCKFCNVWMQGDKTAIKHHEQGKKHKELVEETLKQKRKAKSEAYHSERDLQDQLREIEEAAQAKYAQDMARSGVLPPPPPRRGGQAPPPPPRQPGARGKRSQRSRSDTREEEEVVEQEEPKEDDHGIYAIRGEVFLEGKRHEDKLETGSACQIWVEELDEWLDALIEKTVVHTIPNTDLSFRRFTITYMVPGVPQPTTETEVRSDRLRIKMPAGVTLETAQRMILEMQNGDTTTVEEAVKAQVVIDEETGMGEWSTVVVREIDESEEAIAQREAEAQAEADKIAEEEKRREALEDFSSQGDNALGAFNPWGGSYKGVQIDKDLSEVKRAREEEIMITTNGSVDFKKRKKANLGKKQKRIRSEDDD
uniref:Matrin-type domain-containing protein n=1 Tax=Globisporangium ultimum (strain ATCC 200006 / CBS 805.95 / DAOM BR144) TaxID=431595 RepID=K3WLJ6_GLOUD